MQLPEMQGEYKKNYLLKHLTWFKVGGEAEIFFKPTTSHDLANFLLTKPQNAARFYSSLGRFNNVEDARDAVQRLASRTVPPAVVMPPLLFAVTQEIHNRLSELGKLLNNQSPTIQSAGDEVRQRSGVWVSPLYSQASQKMKNEISGYKLKASGGIIGIDYQISDNGFIGGAYSRSQAIISHKGTKNGDKTKAKVNIFLLYGLQHLTDRWYLEGIISYAASKVKNNEGRRVLVGTEQALGRYNTISYGGQLVSGYNYPIDNTDITPLIGLRYTKFKEGGYYETGTSYQNLTVKKRVYDKIEALVGMRASMNIKVEEQGKPMILVPELYGLINYDLKGKSRLIDARLQGINEPLPAKAFKEAKIFFNCGVGLTVKYNNAIEYGIKYNAIIANKYLAHHPSLKLKIYF